MKTEKLIEELVLASKPVKRLDSPVSRFSRWLLFSISCVTAATLLCGLRSDLSLAIGRAGFSLQAVSALGLAVLSALSAFILSVPDRKRLWLWAIPLITLVLWFGAIGREFLVAENVQGGIGFSCARDIVLFALLPGMLLFWMLRRAAALEPGRVGVLAALAVAALGAAGIQFICMNDDPLHALLWHWLPVALVGGAGFAIGRVMLGKTTSS
ncbi:MAG: DUF1109 family protein [Deltaproteobacteria bacterium]|nr:DUF1109 family protein [Deltaproteobacteria bacterium]